MAFTVNSERVVVGQAIGNVDSSGNAETRGGVIYGAVDISAYAAPEVISAAALGLNVLYGVIFQTGESAEHEVHNAVVAVGGKSVSVTIDDIGTGTEAGTDNVGVVHFVAWGEMLGSGTN